MRLLFGLLLTVLTGAIRCAFVVLPSFLVFVVLSRPEIVMNRGVSLVQSADRPKIHELLPNSRWSDLKPCGEFFDEQKNFDQALSCVNSQVWTKSPLSTETAIPRCFVISAGSPDIYSDRSKTFNFIPIADMFGNIGAVVGVYQPETRTVFVVENVDAPKVYRHELQHFFLHLHDPITAGGGHHQEIWHKCEEPYYSPSIEAKMISAIKAIEESKE